jgi:hypothetical protein
MEKFRRAIDTLLDTAGAELVRQKHHNVYRLPDGRSFVQSRTPSDWRSSRQSLTQLRKLLGTKPLSRAAKIERSAEMIRQVARPRRVPTPNRPQRISGEVILPSGGSFSQTVKPIPRYSTRKQFESVDDVLAAVDNVGSYWALDPCGRTRVLMKLIERFARVDLISVQYVRASGEEIDDSAGPVAEDMETVPPLFAKIWTEWGRTFAPALAVNDPVCGDILLETSSLGMTEGIEQTVLTPAKWRNGVSLVHWGLWLDDVDYGIEDDDEVDEDFSLDSIYEDNADMYVVFLFSSPKMLSKHNCRFTTSEGWTNPSLTRKVIQEALDQQQQQV